MRTCLRTLAAAIAAFAFFIGLAPSPAHASEAAPVAAPAASAALLTDEPDTSRTLLIFNRPVVQFHASLPGMPPVERARRAQSEVARVLQAGGPGTVGLTATPQGKIVLIDGIGVFGLLPDDLVAGQTADEVLRALSQAVQEAREARSFSMLMRATGFAALATLVLAAGVWVLRRLRFWLGRSLIGLGHRHSRRLALGGAALLSRDRVFTLARTVTTLVFYLLLFVLLEAWLGIVLRLFPYTRPWGERLNESTLELAGKLLAAVAASLPGLAVAVVIFFIARGVIGLTTPFFAQVERGDLNLLWIDKYTVRATRGLVHIGVWLFALAMAYPYLPGSQTEAFKGISVVLGVMLSLGSSNVIGQAVSGLILTYSRTLHVGEYVRIGDFEGTVTEMTTFATRIRTGLGEELSLPNSMIVGTVTKNYSRTVKGVGYIVDTVLTIGYDTPWRQVHAMMVEGARRTEGVLETPAPHVFQTALSDFYVEYRLVAQAIASEPRPRAQVMNDLHANLQDVFNENGVQIMSPHYLGDPAAAKIVAPVDWSPPIAPRRGPGASS
jgi:small-conductance mechanosensitive channel